MTEGPRSELQQFEFTAELAYLSAATTAPPTTNLLQSSAFGSLRVLSVPLGVSHCCNSVSVGLFIKADPPLLQARLRRPCTRKLLLAASRLFRVSGVKSRLQESESHIQGRSVKPAPRLNPPRVGAKEGHYSFLPDSNLSRRTFPAPTQGVV